MKPDQPAAPDIAIGHSRGESHLLREVMRTQQALLNVFSREVGMPIARLMLIRIIAINQPNEIGTMEIARQLGINAAAVTRHINEMEKQGLVVRRGDTNDGRRNYVSLTPQGKKAFAGVHERGHQFEKQLGDNSSKKDMATATKVLRELRAVLENIR